VYDERVERRRIIPRWIGRGFQAGALGAVLSGGTLLAFQVSRPDPRLALPQGIDGSLILVPAILALGILATSLPIFAAATRAEAILGSVTGFLVAADLLMAFSYMVRQSVRVYVVVHSLPLGVVAAALAIPVAAIGIAVGTMASEHGFGHSAGLRAVVAASIVAVLAAAIGPWAG
jgi:hypothetical protein